LGILPVVKEDHQEVVADRLGIAARSLTASGYIQDSVNRWTRTATGGYKQQAHEYQLVPTLGLGPSARTYAPAGHYSTDYAVNCGEVANIIRAWKRRIQNGMSPATSGFALSADEQERRHLVFGLMSRIGMDRLEYMAKFNRGSDGRFAAELEVLADLSLIEVTDSGNLRFNQAGLTHSGAIARVCFFSDTVRRRLADYAHR
jgi:coproporphyrinogen III oxidase-like Fe-S oxidoreductase